MSNDLECRLEADMADLAARTPWTSASAGSVRRLATRRHRRRIAVRGAAALLVIAGSVATIAVRRTDNAAGPFVLLDSPPAATPSVEPAGREVPLTPWTDPAADSPTTRARVSLLVDGTQTFGLRLSAYFSHGSLLRYACLTIDGAGICEAAVEVDDGTQNAHLPALGGSDQLLFWTGLPPQTSFVELAGGGGERLWQRPLGRVVAFPIGGWADVSSVIAFDSSGSEVARADLQSTSEIAVSAGGDAQPLVKYNYFWSTPISRGADGPNLAWDALTGEQQNAVTTIADTSMGVCVNDRSTVRDWWSCVDAVNADLASRVATMPGSAYTTLLGHLAPAVSATTTRGEPIDLSARAGHWIVLTFSAATCGPCGPALDELRQFNDEQTQLADGAELYTVATGGVVDDARAFFDSHDVTWPVLLDQGAAIQSAFDVAAIPETWIIDPAGNVVMRIVTSVTADQLTSYLQQARAGR